MVSSVNLRKTGQRWEFESEAALEDFVWANLKKLLGLTPLKRQYRVNGQICDIIATDKNKRLVVLELKNGEDRYIVQQLTRYYDALLEEKPFKEDINYEQPVQLVAITPNFHKDNLTDRKYNHLSIDFLKFEVLTNENNLYLRFKNIDTGKVSQVEIHYQQTDSTNDIPDVPKKLINFLAKCDKSNEKEREDVLRIRNKLLGFDRRMQEIVKANRIEYGRGKNKPCAEFYFSNAFLGFQGRPNLFLRLPEPHPYYRQTILRMHIWTDKDWNCFSGMTNYPRAFISNKVRGSTRYQFPEFIEIIKRCADGKAVDEQPQICYQNYEKLIKNRTNSLEFLVEIALETWLRRV
jgi:RecB family endonuclease NucS